jgi:hypothetical protein
MGNVAMGTDIRIHRFALEIKANLECVILSVDKA